MRGSQKSFKNIQAPVTVLLFAGLESRGLLKVRGDLKPLWPCGVRSATVQGSAFRVAVCEGLFKLRMLSGRSGGNLGC